MTWTYSFNPAHSPKDNVRFLLGDTDKADPILHDEEINFLLKQAGGEPFTAAAQGCEAIMAKLSRAVDESVGSVSIQFSQRLQSYQKLVVTLRRRAAINSGIKPYSGGIRHADRARWLADGHGLLPIFSATDGLLPDFGGWGQYGARADLDAALGGEACQTFGDDAISLREINAGCTDGGNRIISGANDPTAATPGHTGDYYFNTTTQTLFGPHT